VILAKVRPSGRDQIRIQAQGIVGRDDRRLLVAVFDLCINQPVSGLEVMRA
jgi:hypothetical protein